MRKLRVAVNYTDRQDSLFNKYLSDINKYPLLSTSEEVSLAERSFRGDFLARQKLVESNLRFVVTVAKQYGNKTLSLQDLINEGNLGLIRAAEKFDPSKGFKFISYAVWWIRQSIIKGLSDHSEMIRRTLPVNADIRAIDAINDHYFQIHERKATVEELADTLELPIPKIEETLIHSSIKVNSYDVPLSDEKDSASLVDLFPSTDSADRSLDIGIIQNSLKYAISQLPPMRRYIIELRFGFNNLNHMYSYSEISSRTGYTPSVIKRIERKAYINMKRTLSQISISKDILSVLES